MLAEGTLEIIEDPYLDLPFNHALTDAMRARKAKAWAAIEPLTKDIPAIFQSSHRNQQINSRAREVGCHIDSIRDWLNEYWQMGCTSAALFGKRKNCGAPGKPKPAKMKLIRADEGEKIEEAKRGVPRSKTPGTGINISEEHRRIIRIATNLFYKKNKKATLMYTYLKMIRQYYSGNTRVNENGKIEIINPDGVPTYQQFTYWHKKENSEYDVIQSREGKTYFEKTLRPLLGNSTFEAIGPGYRYQIDATIADVYLVSRIDRDTIVGRPVMYVVIDVWSRLIVGLYIGLENASWATAMMAVHNVTLNKVNYCKQFGIDIQPQEWPETPLSSVLLGDRGELLSKQADRLAEVLGIEVENTPPYRADWKGIVERQFRLLPAKFAADVKGYVNKDFGQRTGPDYRLDACLNLHEFTKIAIHCVLEHNVTPVGGYPLENAMVAQRIPAIPNELWTWGIKNRMGSLVRHSESKLLFALLPTANASATAKGISFLGRNYYASALDKRSWFSRARSKGRFKVVISYHPHNLNTVLLHDPVYRDQFTCCTLISNDSSDLDLYVEEVIARTDKAARINASRCYDTIATKITHQKAIEDIAASAEAEKKELGPSTRSKKERISNIRSYRQVEKTLHRLLDADRNVATAPQQSTEHDCSSSKAPPVKLYARIPIFTDDDKSGT
ncbi:MULTISPECIES: transposase family protein [unclassified Massilia]|uniref:transposase family protein n=1 Tax=unclassified Massilia TaxID=2609279 RepID=UPI001E49BEC1|nr:MULTISPECIES: transposase family protein [unclassified Massilia]